MTVWQAIEATLTLLVGMIMVLALLDRLFRL